MAELLLIIMVSGKMKCFAVALLCLAALSGSASAEILGNQVGWYTFHTNVDGATIYVDGLAVGTTVNQQYTYEVYLDGSPSSMPKTAYAAKSGYQNSQVTNLNTPSVGETVDYYFTLNPQGPTTGSVYVSSSPTGSALYVDGSYYGLTPHSVDGLSTGTHSVKVTRSGYQDWGSTVSVSAGQQSSVTATLVPVNDHGTIAVTSTPTRASVYLDGSYQGLSPVTISGVVKGAHVVELNKAGYYEWSGQVNVYAGQVTTVSRTLSSIPNPSTGTLYISSTPSGAYIYLDGSYIGVTPYSGSYVVDNVASGTHTVTLKLSGYSDKSVSTSVMGGGTATVSVNMDSTTPTPAATGTLDITSNPTGANVFINNEYKGIAPFQQSMAAGQYSVTFRLTGYSDSTVSATVNAGGTSSVQGNLVPAAQPTKSGLPPFAVIGAVLAAGLVFCIGKVKRE